MTAPIDTAYVKIEPSFDGFKDELDDGVTSSLRTMEQTIGRLVDSIERIFTDMADEIQSDFRDVTQSAQMAFDRVEEDAGRAGREIGEDFQRGGETAERALNELSNRATREFAQVEATSGAAAAGMASKMKSFGALALVGGVTAAAGGLAALSGFGLKAAASLEQTQVAFNSLLGSAEKGQQVFEDLQRFAAVTPFEFEDVSHAAARFLAFNDAVGLTDDQLQDFLTTIGNVTSVTGGGAQALNSITLAMGQIASSGKLTLDNLNQISEALPGFSGVAAIASAEGITTGEAMDRISSGAISAQQGINDLLKGMQQFPGAAGAMAAQSETLLGVFSTFKDTFSQTLAAGFAPAIPAIKDSLKEITPVIGEALGQLAPALGQALAAIMPILGQLVQALTPVLIPIVKGLGAAFKSLSDSGALPRLGAAIGKLLSALDPLWPVIGEIVGVVADALVPVFLALTPVIESLAPSIVELVRAIEPIIPALGDTLAALGPVLVPLAQLIALIVSFLSNYAILPMVTALAVGLQFLASAVAEFGKWLQTIDWAAVGEAIGGFFADAWKKVTDFFTGIYDFFHDLPVKTALYFTEMIVTIRDKILDAIAYVKTIPGRIVEAIGDLGSMMIDKGKQLVYGLWDGISSLGGWLWQKVSDYAYDNTVGAFKHALGINSPSSVMADEVGKWVPAGVEMGAQANMGSLEAMMSGSLDRVRGQGTALGSGETFGAGAIIINFNGVIPTEAEARRTGAAVADGISSGTRTQLAVRTI